MTQRIPGLLFGLLTLGGLIFGQDTSAVVCSLDKPVVSSNGTVTATAVTGVPNRSALSYNWTATGGEFEKNEFASDAATGPAVHWHPSRASKGSFTLTVVSRTGDQLVGTCHLDVYVSSTVRSVAPAVAAGSGYQTEGAILLEGSPERPGYGLYSYVLLAHPPTDEQAARIHSLLDTYLQEIFAVKDLESYFKSSQLNVTYLPMQKATDDAPTADSILDRYDYARAKLLLSKIPGGRNAGPYIVSCLKPLSAGPTIEGAYLLEDLSAVPASAIPFWVQQFLSQTSQQRFWQPKTLDSMALRLRTAIAIAAEGLPDVRNAVTSWIVLSPGR